MDEDFRPIDRSALFTDKTEQFVSPCEMDPGDVVSFRFRTLSGDADRVLLQSRGAGYAMKKIRTRGRFDYYEVSICMRKEPFSYYFLVEKGEERVIYDNGGIYAGKFENRRKESYFKVYPGFHTPDWAKGAVFYQIFMDRFCNGDPKNDVLTSEYYYIDRQVEHVDWGTDVQPYDVHRFYGGDLIGVRKKLGYLKHLGIDCIYFNPIFVSPSNHKYDSQDYDYIDPHLVGFVHDSGELLSAGSDRNDCATRYMTRVTDAENLEKANAFFADFVAEAHSMGIRVMLDGVFNHCGSFNKWMDREKIYYDKKGYAPGAYVSSDSPYRDHFIFESDNWPDNEDFVGWWGHKTLPKLNYEESDNLHDYVMNIAKRWLNPPYRIDGWRLDVAADLGQSSEYNHKFWKDFRRAVKEENEDALILAEHYGSPGAWLRGDEWDTVMNYDAFMEPLTFFLTGMEKHSDGYDAGLHGNGQAFFDRMQENMSHLPTPALLTAMNELSNHDHSRFMTRTNSTVGRLADRGCHAAEEGIDQAIYKEAVVMQFTLPGAPTIYYGDETGVCGWTDPDSRRTYPWGKEDWNLIQFHRDMIRIHKDYSCLNTGSYIPLLSGSGMIAFGRFDYRSAACTLVNNTDAPCTASIPVYRMGLRDDIPFQRVMLSGRDSYNVGKLPVCAEGGYLMVTIPARSAAVYVCDAR